MFGAVLQPQSNRATFILEVEISDEETGDPIDLTGCTIEVQVRYQAQNGSTVLSGDTEGGEVTILDTGVFQIEFSATQMASICPDTYDVGAIISRDGETAQILIGTIPVLEGVVR